MLSVRIEDVCFIIIKAREFDEKVAPSEQDSEDDPRIVLEDYADDATYTELVSAIECLNEDAQLDLMALMWVGRGDFEPEDYADARHAARDIRNKHVAHYLLGTPLLADYLEEGLEGLGYSCADIEMGHL
ncbi:MAG: DUF3775 domain-containing protein [Alphaproteobacteria bacterium]|nr:MAG: DUF3775 domain-containing protein [Alphaproteobacteria bacterium]